jgi:hypothetical protein
MSCTSFYNQRSVKINILKRGFEGWHNKERVRSKNALNTQEKKLQHFKLLGVHHC